MQELFDPYRKWLGIPPEEQPPNLYRLLGLSHFESDPDVIATAADARMVHLKTFQQGPNGEWSQKLLNEVSAAQLCLLDRQRKAEYDRALREQVGTRRRRPIQPPPIPPPATSPPPPPPLVPPEPPPKISVAIRTGFEDEDHSLTADYLATRRRRGRLAKLVVLILLLGLVAAAAYYRFWGPHTRAFTPGPQPGTSAPAEPTDDGLNDRALVEPAG